MPVVAGRTVFAGLDEDTRCGGGLRARSRALLCEGEADEDLYRESLTLLARTRLRVDLARDHLLYGEWKPAAPPRRCTRATAHRQRHVRDDGHVSLRRARQQGLRATGEAARKRTPTRHEDLTAQEAQIARLARDGLSNPEIGTRLFISAHTVQYHLRKVFAKLGITSRSQLERVLPSEPAIVQQPPAEAKRP